MTQGLLTKQLGSDQKFGGFGVMPSLLGNLHAACHEILPASGLAIDIFDKEAGVPVLPIDIMSVT